MERLRVELTGERVREGLTMALYVSLSLLAVMIAIPTPEEGHEAPDPALQLLLASVGLILAHLIAFQVSSRLTRGGVLDREHTELVLAQLAGGITVTIVAVVPVAIVRGPTGVRLSELALLLFIALVSYATARLGSGASRPRAVGYVLGVVALAGVVLVIKAAAGH